MAARTALGAAGTMQQASYGGQRIPIHRLTPVRYTAQHHPPAVGAARGQTFVIQKLDCLVRMLESTFERSNVEQKYKNWI